METTFSIYEHPAMIPDGFQKQFKELSFEENEGMMWTDFVFWKENMKNYHAFIGCVHSNGKVIGWSFCMEYSPRVKEYNYYCFVREEYRKQGIGTLLFKESVSRRPRHKHYEAITVYGWDKVSRHLYEKVLTEASTEENTRFNIEV